MSDQDDTVPGDPGFETLPDGTLIIGKAAERAQIKKQGEEALANSQGVIAGINEETEKEGNEGYIEGDESSPGTLPERAA